MKKYFAKYITIEGDIKKGDLVMEPNGMVYKVGGHGKDTGFTLLNHLDGSFYDMSDLFNKVKLVLCSRKKLIKKFTYINQMALKWGDKTPGTLIQNTFKVIGEISPDNTWVKENDQFDEEEVFASLIGTMNNEGKSVSLLTPEDINLYYINTKHK